MKIHIYTHATEQNQSYSCVSDVVVWVFLYKALKVIFGYCLPKKTMQWTLTEAFLTVCGRSCLRPTFQPCFNLPYVDGVFDCLLVLAFTKVTVWNMTCSQTYSLTTPVSIKTNDLVGSENNKDPLNTVQKVFTITCPLETSRK